MLAQIANGKWHDIWSNTVYRRRTCSSAASRRSLSRSTVGPDASTAPSGTRPGPRRPRARRGAAAAGERDEHAVARFSRRAGDDVVSVLRAARGVGVPARDRLGDPARARRGAAVRRLPRRVRRAGDRRFVRRAGRSGADVDRARLRDRDARVSRDRRGRIYAVPPGPAPGEAIDRRCRRRAPRDRGERADLLATDGREPGARDPRGRRNARDLGGDADPAGDRVGSRGPCGHRGEATRVRSQRAWLESTPGLRHRRDQHDSRLSPARDQG